MLKPFLDGIPEVLKQKTELRQEQRQVPPSLSDWMQRYENLVGQY